MHISKLLVLVLVILVSSLSLQSCSNLFKRKLYLVHVHGDWCKTCKLIDPVVHSLGEVYKSDEQVEYLVFDETNPETVAESKKRARARSLADLFEYERHTGELLFIDQSSKKILARYLGVDDKRKYIEAVNNLLSGEEVEDISKSPRKYDLSKPDASEILKAKLYLIDVHHDMCGTCSVTAPVFEEVADRYKEKHEDSDEVAFFTFDLSRKETIDETRKLAQELGLDEIYEAQKHTGEVLFVDAKTKRIVNRLVAETSKRKYRKYIKKSLKQIESFDKV